MPTFTVPDNDSDSWVSEIEMAMDIDGDSFEEQIDGITRVQSDPNWQAQELAVQQQSQQQYIQTQKQAQQTSLAYTPTPQQKNHFRPARPTRSCKPFTSRIHDQHMLNADLPSSNGKRKRSESQPPARDTYHSAPDTIYQPTLRRIGGMFVIMSVTAFTWMASAVSNTWAYFAGPKDTAAAQNAQQQEILAIETDNSGRKRRAVTSPYRSPCVESLTSSEDSETSTSQIPKPSSQAPKPSSQATEPRTSRVAKSPSSKVSQLPSSPPISTSPSPPAEEDTAKASNTPGAFPSPSLPSPEQSASPTVEQPDEKRLTFGRKRQIRGTPFPKRNISQPTSKPVSMPKPASSEDPDENPYLKEYPPHISMEPTLAEMRARFPNQGTTQDDWETLKAEKAAERREQERQAFKAWAMRQDRKNADEEFEFCKEEEASEKYGLRRAARDAAVEVKYPPGLTKEELEFWCIEHGLNHGKGECNQNCTYQIMHECDGLQAHYRGRVMALEVAQDDQERSEEEKSSAGEGRAFQKTSARRRFRINGKNTQNTKQPYSAAAAKATNGSRAGATEQETSRPTTASSHRPATYKDGVEPTPQKTAPGSNMQRPWSWDQTMLPGRSLLKRQENAKVKDRQINDLIDRGKRAIVQSPKDGRLQDYLRQRRERRRDDWIDYKGVEHEVKIDRRSARAQEKEEAVQKLEEIQTRWAQMALEEEEAARRAAEELAKQKAIEGELARKAAEEAEKLKAEQEEAQATYARKQILIRPLDPEWADRVQKTLDIVDKDAIVAKSLDGTELSRHDFKSLLDNSAWLNDEIVNAFMAAIVARKQEQAGYKRGANNVPPYEAYNSAWYTTYKKSGITGIQRWSKRKGIQGDKLLRAEKIFFPINTGAHWNLLIISPKEKSIEFLCSLNRKSAIYFKAAREWLEMELGPNGYVAEEWTESAQRSNMQTNTDDCGVFVAMNGLAAAKEHPFTDVSAAKMVDARRMVAAVLLNGGLVGDWEL